MHIGLVDSLGRITVVGKKFVQRCSKYENGRNKQKFISFVLSEIGALTLIQLGFLILKPSESKFR